MFQPSLIIGVALILVTAVAMAVWALKDTWFGSWIAEGDAKSIAKACRVLPACQTEPSSI